MLSLLLAGRYVRSNLNMPPSLPLWGGQRDYDMDAPITVFGSVQARLVGMWPVAGELQSSQAPRLSHVLNMCFCR